MISHPHKTIFIHIPKAARQSVENLFLKDLDLSWDNRLPLLLGPNSNSETETPLLAHLLAREYYENHFISRDLFDIYTKFAVVRNPFTRLVSTYTYMKIPTGFDRFVTEILPETLWQKNKYFVRPQIDFITGLEGDVIADHVFRFEDIAKMETWLSGHFGTCNLKLEHINKSLKRFDLLQVGRSILRYGKPDLVRNRRDRDLAASRNYGQLFASLETRRVVEELYKSDFDEFGYDFVKIV